MQPRDPLTRKEIQVATLVWEGLTNREIAKVIGTTEQVVKNYLRTAFNKLGVWSRLELALYIASHEGVNWVTELGLDAGLQGAEPELSRVAYAGRWRRWPGTRREGWRATTWRAGSASGLSSAGMTGLFDEQAGKRTANRLGLRILKRTSAAKAGVFFPRFWRA